MPKELTGPEALHALARQSEAQGLSVNADHFTRLAKQWEAADHYIVMLETRLAVTGQLIPQRPLPRHNIIRATAMDMATRTVATSSARF